MKSLLPWTNARTLILWIHFIWLPKVNKETLSWLLVILVIGYFLKTLIVYFLSSFQSFAFVLFTPNQVVIWPLSSFWSVNVESIWTKLHVTVVLHFIWPLKVPIHCTPSHTNYKDIYIYIYILYHTTICIDDLTHIIYSQPKTHTLTLCPLPSALCPLVIDLVSGSFFCRGISQWKWGRNGYYKPFGLVGFASSVLVESFLCGWIFR